jgi:hypothetical protein
MTGLVVWCAAGALRASATSALEVKVNPSVSFAPSHVKIVVSVTPDPDNRRLTVEAESVDFYRSSEVTLNGTEAALTHSIEWRELPAGEYRVVAHLHGSDGERVTVERSLSVYDGNGLTGQ